MSKTAYGRTAGVDPVWNSHDLSLLWTRFEATLEGFGADDPDGATAAVATIVAEFATV